MSLDQQLRDHYRATDDATAPGPDLGSVLHHGRRRRRSRYAGVVGAAAAVIVAGGLVTSSLIGAGDDGTVTDSNRGQDQAVAAPRQDFVPGTDIDQMMSQVIAEHLPLLGDPTDVYPSDWDHSGPMPDADFAAATDWQAAYDVGGGERFLLLMGYPEPGEPTGCPDCHSTRLPGATLMTQVSRLETSGEWVFLTSLVRDDGFSVNAIDYVEAPELADARAQRSVSDAEAAELVRDPRLRFARPAGR